MTDDTTPNDMKARAKAALEKKLAATQANSHGDAKANGKASLKGTKQPKQRIIRHQGR